jgi:excisionase family DNA binding protein
MKVGGTRVPSPANLALIAPYPVLIAPMNSSRLKALGPLPPIDRLSLAKGDWLSPIQVAHYIGCCLDTVYRAIKRGQLRAVRFGQKRWRIRREWVDEQFLHEVRYACECEDRFTKRVSAGEDAAAT